MNATQIEFRHKAVNWVATLDCIDQEAGIGRLTVRPDNYDDDCCNGQKFARSAWFKACEELELDPADEQESHSGGSYSRNVKPEAEAVEN